MGEVVDPVEAEENAHEEKAAQLQLDVIFATEALMEDHGYTLEDVLTILRQTLGRTH